MSLDSLKDVYEEQLQDLVSACAQSRDAVKELTGAAKNADLVDALEAGAVGIEDGIKTLTAILETHGTSPKGEHCKAMEGLAAEARSDALRQEFGDDDARDAMIIAQYQRMTHYAMAGYGTCVAFAKRLGQEDDAKMIQHCLDKTHDGDRRFTHIATHGVNAVAA